MKLLIEEQIFTWRDRFTVMDECGNDRYHVKGELFSWGKKLHVTDLSGREVAYVEQQLFTFLPRYAVYAGGVLIGEVVKEFSFFRPLLHRGGRGLGRGGGFLGSRLHGIPRRRPRGQHSEGMVHLGGLLHPGYPRPAG